MGTWVKLSCKKGATPVFVNLDRVISIVPYGTGAVLAETITGTQSKTIEVRETPEQIIKMSLVNS